MAKLFHEKPSLKRKEAAIEYIQEHLEHGSAINGSGSLDKFLQKNSYEEWLEELDRRTKLSYITESGWAMSETYFLIRAEDDRLVGMTNLRYKISKDLFEQGCSHIGYGIRPSERKKGYNKVNLYLRLSRELELGEQQNWMECAVNNIASNKTTLALGGKLAKSEIDPYDGILTNYYWIDAKKTVDDFRDVYVPLLA